VALEELFTQDKLPAAALQAPIPAGSIHLDAQCTGVSSVGAAVATLADGREVEADIVVGADGINSAVRESLFGEQAARWTQQMAWRCIVPIDCVPTRIGPGKSVAIGRDEYVGWIGPDGHVICYPIRGGKLYNIFAGHVSEPASSARRGACLETWAPGRSSARVLMTAPTRPSRPSAAQPPRSLGRDSAADRTSELAETAAARCARGFLRLRRHSARRGNTARPQAARSLRGSPRRDRALRV